MVVNICRGTSTFSKLGVQFLGLGYHYPSTEKIDRSIQFGAIGYNHTIHQKATWILGGPSKFWGSGPHEFPVVALMFIPKLLHDIGGYGHKNQFTKTSKVKYNSNKRQYWLSVAMTCLQARKVMNLGPRTVRGNLREKNNRGKDCSGIKQVLQQRSR